MTPTRNKDSYRKYLHDFVNDIYVTCPSCQQQAIVRAQKVKEPRWQDRDIKVTCPSCGYSKKQEVKAAYLYGAPVDPYFKLAVWLATPCCGHTLWAYNYEHLDFLKKHVEAKLRERNTHHLANRSIGSKLPRWMTSAKNREIVLKTIAQLRLR